MTVSVNIFSCILQYLAITKKEHSTPWLHMSVNWTIHMQRCSLSVQENYYGNTKKVYNVPGELNMNCPVQQYLTRKLCTKD